MADAESASIASLLKRLDAKDATIARLTAERDALRAACEEVLAYRTGSGRFDLTRIACGEERENAAADLWAEVENQLRAAIAKARTP